MPPDQPIRTARGLSAVLAVLLAVVGVLALPAPARAEEPPSALLRVVHLSPDTPAVDVTLTPAASAPDQVLTDTGPVIESALAYGGTGAYRQLASGSYAVSVRAPGSTAAPVLSARVDLRPGQARTVVLGGPFADLALSPIDDDLSTPPAGSARVRVIGAATDAVDVSLAGGPTLATDLGLGAAADPVTVPGGPHRARLTGADSELPLDLPAGSVLTLLALDAPGGGTTLRTVTDAAGPSVRPVGGVPAGGTPGLPGTTVSRVVAALTAAGSLAGRARVSTAAPVRLRLPGAGIDAGLTGAGLDGAGALVPPSDPRTAGWFTGGPRPGEIGPAVLTGHVDWAGRPGSMAGLGDAAVGDEVLVDGANGSVARFRVTAVDRYAKDAFPTERVYSPTAAPELRLITCGGLFEGGNYRDNVVVSARLIS